MIRKEIYENAGGLDEKSFKVSFNDVDFCLRVEKLGYRNLWTPFSELVHHESASRGDDQSTIGKRIRSSGEILRLQNRWSLKSYRDPNYNPNLTQSSEQYWFGLTGKKNLSLQKVDLIQRDEKRKLEISTPQSQKVSLLNQMGKSHVSPRKEKGSYFSNSQTQIRIKLEWFVF